MSRRGITTNEGLMKASDRFQRDDNEADTNQDGELSPFERERGDAIQKDTTMKFSKGGMMADDALGYDEESGNPIPLGSSDVEVRDDIDAKLSTGEFVLPADVVRYHGLKNILGMIDEAKYGLMCMHEDGYLKVSGEETEEEDDEDDSGIEVASVEVTEETMHGKETYKSNPRMIGMAKQPKIVFAI
jgi:hypothetical protein